jgi:hypothetical protein
MPEGSPPGDVLEGLAGGPTLHVGPEVRADVVVAPQIAPRYAEGEGRQLLRIDPGRGHACSGQPVRRGGDG